MVCYTSKPLNLTFDISFLFPADSSEFCGSSMLLGALRMLTKRIVAIVLDFRGNSTRSEVNSKVRLNRLQKLYEEDGFVKSVQEAMKDKDVSDDQKKDVDIEYYGPNKMHVKFANSDIQWPFACFKIDFARKRSVKQVKTAFENCLKEHINSKRYGEESGLMVCCDHAQGRRCYDKHTFYVVDRILLKESLERIVNGVALGLLDGGGSDKMCGYAMAMHALYKALWEFYLDPTRLAKVSISKYNTKLHYKFVVGIISFDQYRDE